MPKANRYFVQGQVYHLTHRCHNKSFLLKFARDRNMYRSMLRERLKKYRVPLLGYCITSNHVHLLVLSSGQGRISRMMDSLEGDFASYYNRRKKRSGAFWGGRYHATAVDKSEHLWNVLVYIDLNMVRAGVVKHPSDWSWSGFEELVGTRQRYGLIDFHHVGNSLGLDPKSDHFHNLYLEAINTKIHQNELFREPAWTEGLAVGREAFIESISEHITGRKTLKSTPYGSSGSKGLVLREAGVDYA